jgi:hypothetical protein
MFRTSPSGSDAPGEGAAAGVLDLLSQASTILTREGARLPAALPGVPNFTPGGTPSVPGIEPLKVPTASVPGSGLDPDRLRRYGHEIIESLIAAVSPKAPPLENRVPLFRCAAAVQAGRDGIATLTVANDEISPSQVTLYCTNFVADSGCDIPSLRVTCTPRTVTIPAKGEATFQIKIAVPQQAPAGIYSGLIQAMGAQYVKAVLSVEVM